VLNLKLLVQLYYRLCTRSMHEGGILSICALTVLDRADRGDTVQRDDQCVDCDAAVKPSWTRRTSLSEGRYHFVRKGGDQLGEFIHGFGDSDASTIMMLATSSR
jgi:hypothetical protein